MMNENIHSNSEFNHYSIFTKLFKSKSLDFCNFRPQYLDILVNNSVSEANTTRY